MKTGVLSGASAAPGCATGWPWAPRAGRGAEQARFVHAQAAAIAELAQAVDRFGASAPTQASDLLRVHHLLTGDPSLLGPVAARIDAGQRAEAALEATAAELSTARLPGRGDPSEEGRSVLQRIRRHLYPPARPHGPVVIVGDPPDISDVLALHEAGRLAAIAAPGGGPDSHLGLLARELGVPAVMGTGPGLWELVATRAPLRVDGDRGVVRPAAGPMPTTLAPLPSPSAVVPGFAVRAALSSPAGVQAARAAAAEGVGLLRSDSLWGTPGPTLASVLLRTVEAAGPQGLTLRVYDRPALGLPRGPALLAAQPGATAALLEAACRAQAAGPLRLLLPCVVRAEQVGPWRDAIARTSARLGRPPPQLGVMLETPAAALMPAPLLAAADFGVVGTGDLCALLGGTDREALGEAEREAVTPILMRLLAAIAGAAAATDRAVEVAGPAARHPALVLALRDLGFMGVSVAPADVAPVRHALRAHRA